LTIIDPSAASVVRGLVPFFGIGSLGVEPPVFVFRKRATPPVGKIEVRHVEHEHWIVADRPWSKKAPQPAPEIVFTLFCFHDDFLLV
jgi:hypothetical protein